MRKEECNRKQYMKEKTKKVFFHRFFHFFFCSFSVYQAILANIVNEVCLFFFFYHRTDNLKPLYLPLFISSTCYWILSQIIKHVVLRIIFRFVFFYSLENINETKNLSIIIDEKNKEAPELIQKNVLHWRVIIFDLIWCLNKQINKLWMI